MTNLYCGLCGCLLDRSWSRWHAPTCPNRDPLVRIAASLQRIEARLDRVLALALTLTHDQETT